MVGAILEAVPGLHMLEDRLTAVVEAAQVSGGGGEGGRCGRQAAKNS